MGAKPLVRRWRRQRLCWLRTWHRGIGSIGGVGVSGHVVSATSHMETFVISSLALCCLCSWSAGFLYMGPSPGVRFEFEPFCLSIVQVSYVSCVMGQSRSHLVFFWIQIADQ